MSLFRSVAVAAALLLGPSPRGGFVQLAPGTIELHTAMVLQDGAEVDRKSTRLNSSHSLHVALPICGGRRRTAARALAARRVRATGARHYRTPHGDGASGRCGGRSEEHTSELQSLPTCRSSDLWRSPPHCCSGPRRAAGSCNWRPALSNSTRRWCFRTVRR